MTEEPTPEQIEAAARVVDPNAFARLSVELEAAERESLEMTQATLQRQAREQARAALVAAAGAAVSGSTSGGHHTFDELFDYRMMLYNARCTRLARCWHPRGEVLEALRRRTRLRRGLVHRDRSTTERASVEPLHGRPLGSVRSARGRPAARV